MKNKKLKLPYVLYFLLMAGLLVGGALLLYNTSETTDDTASADETPQQTQTVNLSPPTPEEQAAGDEQKEQNVANENREKPTTASVAIVDASQTDQTISVRAFVSNVVENGTCTVTFTNSGAELSYQTAATADASTTLCAPLSVPRADFPQAGTWDVVVSYENSTLTGSAASTIDIE